MGNSANVKPKFYKKTDLTIEQLTDPDYRLKQIKKQIGNRISVMCSKCHHCR